LDQSLWLMTERERAMAYQWRWPSVDELMLCPSRHDHQIPGFDILVFAVDGGAAHARGEGQGLVDCVDLPFISSTSMSFNNASQEKEPELYSIIASTHLIPNITSHRHRHQHDLRI